VSKVAERSQRPSKTFPPFQAGQVWRVGERMIEVRRVGRTLVHHRFIQENSKRPSAESFNTPAEFEKILREHKGVLIKG
jgi:hypothetical protein